MYVCSVPLAKNIFVKNIKILKGNKTKTKKKARDF